MTKVTEFVKISTLVLVQQQQLGSLLLSSRSTLRLAVAVRLVIPLLYSLKRFDAVGPLLLRPIPSPVAGSMWGAVVSLHVRSNKLAEGGAIPADDRRKTDASISSGQH